MNKVLFLIGLTMFVLAAATTALVQVQIPLANAAPNDNPSCVGNPHTSGNGDPHPDDITGNAHRSGGDHHCPGQK